MNREVNLIETITAKLPTRPDTLVGVGDDCAVIDNGPDHSILLKTDAIVEGVHFKKNDPADKVGHKALARALSDIAAMAGEPNSALITLGLPGDFDQQWVETLYEGLNATARAYDVAIVGGETVSSPERIFCSVALTGKVGREQAVLRKNARVRDALFVTGELGGSIEGKHLDFTPRIKEAQWLAEHFVLHSMIDLSDGLAGDLQHICKASGVGAEVWTDYLPVSRVARLQAKQGDAAKPAVTAALTDGEDFELLFSIAPADAVKLKDQWREAFPETPISCIGKIMEQPGIHLKDEQGIRPLSWHGYDHFQ